MKNNILDLTVIIPINKLEIDLDKQLFGEAIKSVFNQNNSIEPKEVIVITNTETSKLIDLKEFKSARFVINDETSDNVQSQINKAVAEVEGGEYNFRYNPNNPKDNYILSEQLGIASMAKQADRFKGNNRIDYNIYSVDHNY